MEKMRLGRFLSVVCSGVLLGVIVSRAAYSEGVYQDPLDTPAEMRTTISQRPMMAVARAGERLVAVGPRGMIAVSDDEGATWSQARVPVQSDLLSAYFPTAQEGWAVGHEGVVLHTSDGGKTWSKQLDGRAAKDLFLSYYEKGPSGPNPNIVNQLNTNFRAGPALPFLDVWFEDAKRGYVVGSFGMIAFTGDGGQTWVPWLDRVDNPEYFNLNAIRGIGKDIFIVGESGEIYKLDRAQSQFHRFDTGYKGSFFGIAGNGNALVAFGLQGVAYRSTDEGVHWQALVMPSGHTVTAGTVVDEDSRFVLVNEVGQILEGGATGSNFHVLSFEKGRSGGAPTGIALLEPHGCILSGMDGFVEEKLQ